MAKVTGIGGVFSRCPDPQKTIAWYRDHLGVDLADDYPGFTTIWAGGEATIWSAFDDHTDYFGPSGQTHMINYRVDDLAGMLAQLRAAGVQVIDAEEHSEFGHFGWAIDCDGRRIELWQDP